MKLKYASLFIGSVYASCDPACSDTEICSPSAACTGNALVWTPISIMPFAAQVGLCGQMGASFIECVAKPSDYVHPCDEGSPTQREICAGAENMECVLNDGSATCGCTSGYDQAIVNGLAKCQQSAPVPQPNQILTAETQCISDGARGSVKMVIPFTKSDTKIVAMTAGTCTAADTTHYKFTQSATDVTIVVDIAECGLDRTLYDDPKLRNLAVGYFTAEINVELGQVNNGDVYSYYIATIKTECGTQFDYVATFEYGEISNGMKYFEIMGGLTIEKHDDGTATVSHTGVDGEASEGHSGVIPNDGQVHTWSIKIGAGCDDNSDGGCLTAGLKGYDDEELTNLLATVMNSLMKSGDVVEFQIQTVQDTSVRKRRSTDGATLTIIINGIVVVSNQALPSGVNFWVWVLSVSKSGQEVTVVGEAVQAIPGTYNSYGFQIKSYTDDTYTVESSNTDFLAGTIVHLAVVPTNPAFNFARYNFVAYDCEFKNVDQNTGLTLYSEDQCTNSFVNLALSEGGNQWRISHRVFVYGNGSGSQYNLICKIRLCDNIDAESQCVTVRRACL